MAKARSRTKSGWSRRRSPRRSKRSARSDSARGRQLWLSSRKTHSTTGRRTRHRVRLIPPYSSTLNAIEPLWKDVKREISPTIFEDKDHFRQFLTKTFLRLSHRLSFAGDWSETFLPDIQVLQ
ncbi:transposase [Natribaculum luteum]|uniref:Transposase n=1 Tax=Natribaculum luteum TaxID=1586232 RepID=A0ABD5NZY3_9EURY